MLRIPFPSTGSENITLFRGGKRVRRDALKDVMNSTPITILKRPTPPTPQPPPPPPPVTILMNPNRHPATAQAPSSQDASPAPIPAPISRSTAHLSFAIVVPADYSPHRRGGGKAASAKFRPELMVRLPKVIIHEPVWWDKWTDVDHPATSHGKLLDVPPVNWRGKLDTDDLVRYYPKEKQTKRRYRCLERARSSRSSAARRLQSSCQKTEKARSRWALTPAPSASATSPPPVRF